MPMRHGAWTYNGSMFYNGKFLAEMDSSIAAMVTDPEALMNNRQPGHDNDQIWAVDRSPDSSDKHASNSDNTA